MVPALGLEVSLKQHLLFILQLVSLLSFTYARGFAEWVYIVWNAHLHLMVV